MPGLLQPPKNVARHGAKPVRPLFALWPEQTKKRVEVVTGHDGPAGRQHVDQLRVTVVDDMKQIVIVLNAAEKPRIIHEAVDETIGIPRLFLTHQWKTRDSGAQFWPHLLYGKPWAADASQVSAKHVRYQVHARPLLLEIVADHGDPDRPVGIERHRCCAGVGQNGLSFRCHVLRRKGYRSGKESGSRREL